MKCSGYIRTISGLREKKIHEKGSNTIPGLHYFFIFSIPYSFHWSASLKTYMLYINEDIYILTYAIIHCKFVQMQKLEK